jgi:hypothetical protein
VLLGLAEREVSVLVADASADALTRVIAEAASKVTDPVARGIEADTIV